MANNTLNKGETKMSNWRTKNTEVVEYKYQVGDRLLYGNTLLTLKKRIFDEWGNDYYKTNTGSVYSANELDKSFIKMTK